MARTGLDLSPAVTTMLPLNDAEKAVELAHHDPGQVKVHMVSEAGR
jgi:threonine dehydrogenase-like Zn-dependent dehydrogenase